jgi:cadmium resistance transport/sequestration family protein
MQELLRAAATAIVAFAATNIDDIFILTLFFAGRNRRLRRRHIILGQYAGFAALVALSLLGYFARLVVPEDWIGFLGLLPIIIGCKKLWELKRSESEEAHHVEKPSAHAVFTVAAVTFANGGDNLGIYTPLFASSTLPELIITLAVFLIMVGLWCVLGYFLGRHPAVGRVLDRYGHLLVPFVLVALGLYIMIESGSIRLLLRAPG